MFNGLTIPNSKHHCPDAGAVVECTQSEEGEWAGSTPEVVVGSNLAEVGVGSIGFGPGRIGEGEGMSSLCFPWLRDWVKADAKRGRRNAGVLGKACRNQISDSLTVTAKCRFFYFFPFCQESMAADTK
jgi:hypothetical protein